MFEMLCLLKKLHNKKFPVNFPVMREGSIDSSDKNGVTKVFFSDILSENGNKCLKLKIVNCIQDCVNNNLGSFHFLLLDFCRVFFSFFMNKQKIQLSPEFIKSTHPKTYYSNAG